MNKFFKLLSSFLIVASLFFLVTFKTEALSYDENGFENTYDEVITSGLAYYMSTEYGEDASSEIRFHYQSTQNDTYIMFTLASDTDFSNAQKIEVRCNQVDYYTPETGSDGKKVETDGFPDVFYECEAEADGLEPMTLYKWYATDGKTKSRLMTFETAPNDNSSYMFCYTADSQVYAETGLANYSKAALEHLYDLVETKVAKDENNHMSFFVNGGDTVENAGRANYWDYFWNHEFAQKYAMMSFIGNHDFTGLISSGTVDGRFWASQYNFPRNGCEGAYQETSYFFKYGDTLFVFLSCSRGAINAEVTWLDQVLANNPSQYIICGVHYPSNVTGDHSRELVPIFDKYGVDLVLQGHGHSYVLWKNYYNYEPSKIGEGTTYMEMGSPNFTDGRAIFALITVGINSIKVECYNYDGALVDNYILNAKRPSTSTISEFDEEKFLKNTKVQVEQTTRTTANLVLDDSAYGNIQSVEFVVDSRTVLEKTVYSTKYLNFGFSGLTPDTDYTAKLTAKFKDGTSKTYDMNFTTSISSYADLDNIVCDDGEDYYRITYTIDYHPSVASVKSYLNGEFYKDLSMKSGRLSIDKLDFIDGVNTIELRGVLKDGKEVVLYTWTYGEEAKIEYSLTLNFNGGIGCAYPQTFEHGSDITLPTPTRDGFEFKGWFEGETQVTSLEDRDYELTAKWEEIPEPIDPEPIDPEPIDPEPIPDPEPEPDPEPTPEPVAPKEETKSGCKNAMRAVFVAISLLGILMIRRRKDY